ncbi:ribosome-inactivating family protein [Streptomyces sp. QTS52]
MTMTPPPGAGPTASGRGHKRRSRWLNGKFLVLFLAVATLLGGAALAAPQFQEKASAINDGRDITWDINGGRAAYDTMINAVRQRATGGRVLREGVLQTNPNANPSRSENIFAIDLRASNVPSSSDGNNVRLIMRARDLFIIGYQIRDGRGSGTPNYFQGDTPGLPNELSDEFAFTGSYTDLERVGSRSRRGMAYNEAAVTSAYTSLRDDRNQAAVARSLMLFIMTIAEAARFDPLDQAFGQVFGGLPGGVISAAETELMNSWSRASGQLLNALNNGAAINFRVDDPETPEVDFSATTIAGMALILGICLLSV